MKRTCIVSVVLLLQTIFCIGQTRDWKPVPGSIMSPWAEKVNPANPLPEDPRPQLVRGNWKSLNGLWNYAIQPKGSTAPKQFEGKILVPYAVESTLSGVKKTVGKDSILWYKSQISIPRAMKGKRLLLHFGAVDWDAQVFVNGKKVGDHQGGYDPFSFDITRLTGGKSSFELLVRVWDPTDDGPQPRGKQVKKPAGIWYTPVTGIWQTVWLEAVPQSYISSTRQTPDIDRQVLTVRTEVENAGASDQVRISAWNGNRKVAEKLVAANAEAVLPVANPQLWSPQNPFLYDLRIDLVRNGRTIDEVKSYFAMRKISMKPDSAGVQRLLLNNKFLFQFGPLDQGWWPDGLYTAPTDEALLFDIQKTKDLGFNMIRKHTKVEPARWYYDCDKLGMLVWQDMPTGDLENEHWESHPGLENDRGDKIRTAESERIYRKEWAAIMESLYNFPSIVVWVPFNEAWGQFKTVEITNWTMKNDTSRLVNSASGGNYFSVGHIVDLHNYPAPAMPRVELFGAKRALVLGEFGGLGLPLEGHTWKQKDNWGYQTFKNSSEVFAKYESFVHRLETLIGRGLSAAVYTQTTDVEVEVNGLMTYDRKVVKMPEADLKRINTRLYDPALARPAGSLTLEASAQ